MKTSTLITTLLTTFTLSVFTAKAEVNISTVTNAVFQAQQAVNQANQVLSNAEALAAKVLPSSTNSPATVTNNVVETSTSTNGVKATINDAVIDILHGAKTASGEIYQASKTAITKAVDFTIEQAPLVVTEFLHWKLAEATIYSIAWLIPAIALLFIGRACYKRSISPTVPAVDRVKTDQNDYAILKWVARFAALTFITINLTTQGLTITKIIVAPRVYLIEYVVSTIHNGVPPTK